MANTATSICCLRSPLKACGVCGEDGFEGKLSRGSWKSVKIFGAPSAFISI